MSMSQVGSGLPRLLAERYELSERLADGGMTSVWRGHDRVLGRDVAIKVLHPELAADPSFRARFSEEAVNAARLTHPSIVALYDTGEQHGVAYIVLEWVEGASLAELLDRHGPLPPAKAARLASEVALALEYAHGAGVVHRNLKPANILICEDGTVKVSDFSIAKAATEDDPARTGELLGVTGHLAPELAEADEADGRADVYGLGACLFEMLTGRAPAVAGRGASGPMGPRSLRAGVPRELDAVVTRAMARDPERRFPTAQAMATALARSAAADDEDTRAIVRHPPEPPSAAPAEPEESFIRYEGRWLGWTLVLVGLAAVLVVVGLTLSKTVGPILGTSGKPRAAPPNTEGTTPASRPLEVQDTQSFDPEVPGGTENESATKRAVDDDTGTSWGTDGYKTADFGRLKSGVGLILDLGQAKAARTLTLTLQHPDGKVAVYGAGDENGGPPAGLGAWDELAPSKLRPAEAKISLKPGSYRYYLVWFTELPPDGQGKFRNGIAEASLLS
jgi:serine/threonine protein kinase